MILKAVSIPKRILHHKSDERVEFHYRTEHYPMSFSPKDTGFLKYVENGAIKNVTQSLELGPAVRNDFGTVDGLMINEINNY